MKVEHTCARCGKPYTCPNPDCAAPKVSGACPHCVETAPNVVRQGDGLIMIYPDDFPRERMVGVPIR